MISLVFFFEDNNKNVYSGRPHDIGIWRETVKNLGVDHLVMIDETSDSAGALYNHNDEEIEFSRFKSLGEAQSTLSGEWVYLEEDGDSIENFVHPSGDTIYVVGPDSRGLDHVEGNTYVSIDTKSSIWSIAAASIILWDRRTKEL